MEALIKAIETQGLAVALLGFIVWKGAALGERFVTAFNVLSDESVKQTEVLRGIQAHFIRGERDKTEG